MTTPSHWATIKEYRIGVSQSDGYLNKKGNLIPKSCKIVTVARALILQYSFGRPVILALFYKGRRGNLRHFICLIKTKLKTFSYFACSSLLLGLVFSPLNAKASILTSLFGSDAFASGDNGQGSDKNSQSMDLLEANVSSSSIFDKKSSKKDDIDLNKDVKIVADSALSPDSSPASSKAGDAMDSADPISDQVSVYVVRKGDTIAQVAEMFNVSTNTILWANNLKKGDKLVEGDTLIILPVSGVSHTVVKGQTLKGIAKKYNVDASDIAALNGISEDEKLVSGDVLIIPDAEIVDNTDNTSPNPKPKPYVNPKPLQILEGYFVNPVPGYSRRSQGLHGHNGVDLAAPKGTPIVAAAPGVVLFARTGYNGGYGTMVIVNHPNGTQTLYGHMSKLGTHTGDVVNQGEVIGYVGSTGHSTGPHLHFEVHGAKNPAVNL